MDLELELKRSNQFDPILKATILRSFINQIYFVNDFI